MGEAHPLADSVLANRYRLVSPIARGGMAEVWEAFDEILSRAVAVKVLLPHLAVDDDVRARFRAEAVAAARLSHPNIVATFDTGAEGAVPYIVMELVRGRTLRDELTHVSPLPTSRALRIAAQVASALDHAHRAGLIHRDVKPGNILLRGGRDDVKVADFGIAKATVGGVDDLTKPGVLLGTAKYLSPEQARGEEPDARSDLYSLGVVLYEMLCGRPPFDAETDMATAYAHAHGTPPPPRQVRSGLPRTIEAVVMKAMAKQQDARFQSAADLHAALVALDPGADDAVPAVEREPTPPAGVTPVFARSERSWLASAFVIILAAAALVTAAVAFSRSEVGRGLVDQVRRGPAGPATIVEAHSFDPGGDGAEDEHEVGAVFDGDPATEWTSDRYNSRSFGNLKDGVGVWVRLDRARHVRTVRLTSTRGGWTAAVYVADEPSSTLDKWGRPAVEAAGNAGDTVFQLDARGSVVLMWFTALGERNTVSIGGLVVEGA